MIPTKSAGGKWVELRGLGSIGESFFPSYIASLNGSCRSLNFDTFLDTLEKALDWDVLKEYPKIPDFIVKDSSARVFFAEIKTKATDCFYINERDYLTYLDFSTYLPVVVYFLFVDIDKKPKALYAHTVTARDYPKKTAWDGNVVLDMRGYANECAIKKPVDLGKFI